MDVVLLGEVSDLISDVNTNVANVKSVVDTISSNTAINNTASSTGTLSQKLTHLCQQLGTSSDSASSGTTSGGTAMSKLNAILSKVNSGARKVDVPIKMVSACKEIAIGQTVTNNLLNVTGSGVFCWFFNYPLLPPTASSTVKITIDGNVVYNVKLTSSMTSRNYCNIALYALSAKNDNDTYVYVPSDIDVGSLTSKINTISKYISPSSSLQTCTATASAEFFKGWFTNPLSFNSSLRIDVTSVNSGNIAGYENISIGYGIN